MTDTTSILEKPKQTKARKQENVHKEIFKWYGWGTPLGLSILVLSASMAICWLIFAVSIASRIFGR